MKIVGSTLPSGTARVGSRSLYSKRAFLCHIIKPFVGEGKVCIVLLSWDMFKAYISDGMLLYFYFFFAFLLPLFIQPNSMLEYT